MQPDLLKIIERRMKADPWHVEHGFTIVPRTSNNEGLNFLDIDATSYLNRLQEEVRRNNVVMDKPLAFLLNPPYKNTDENVAAREASKSEYAIHPSILELTGDDAGKERYLAFLGQILNMARVQAEQLQGSQPVVMIFTPTSWLLPRPTYQNFRNIWDQYFEYQSGFIITSNEFFKLDGKWPLAFTIWKYNYKETGNKNIVKVKDFTEWEAADLNILWEQEDEKLRKELKKLMRGKKDVKLHNNRGYIKDWIEQKMYDFKRDKTKEEKESSKPCGGLPLSDERRKNKKTYGVENSEFIGFMDDMTPVRVKGKDTRFTNSPDRVWFQLRPGFIDINLTKVQSGTSDKYGYCAFNLESAKIAFTWFALTKAINGFYPIWSNQYDIWRPNITPKEEKYWYSLCYAFALAENRCVVTKFEADNPIDNAPEVFVDNPLCPVNPNSFWITILAKEILKKPSNNPALLLVEAITEVYRYWNNEYCKGQTLEHVGLKNEPYFKYFDYPDFVTPHSGLIQIKKYAEQNASIDLLNKFSAIQKLTKAVKNELYRLLVKEFKYFE